MVQDFNCVQMRVSRCNGHYQFVLGAGVEAKSVTNNLPLLSVLAVVILLSFYLPSSSLSSIGIKSGLFTITAAYTTPQMNEIANLVSIINGIPFL
jgi:hypothetical protein